MGCHSPAKPPGNVASKPLTLEGTAFNVSKTDVDCTNTTEYSNVPFRNTNALATPAVISAVPFAVVVAVVVLTITA